MLKAVEPHLAGRGFAQPGQDRDRGRLSGAIGAQQPHDRARGDAEADVANRRDGRVLFVRCRMSSMACVRPPFSSKRWPYVKGIAGTFRTARAPGAAPRRRRGLRLPIANAIADSTGKRVILASVYNTLERLEQKGLVTSSFGEPTAERGGRAKRYFSITRAGFREVRAAKKALTVLWRGIPVHEG